MSITLYISHDAIEQMLVTSSGADTSVHIKRGDVNVLQCVFNSSNSMVGSPTGSLVLALHDAGFDENEIVVRLLEYYQHKLTSLKLVSVLSPEHDIEPDVGKFGI